MPSADSAARTHAMWNPFANMAAIAGHAVRSSADEGATVYDSAAVPTSTRSPASGTAMSGTAGSSSATLPPLRCTRSRAYQTYEVFSNAPAEALAERDRRARADRGREGVLHPRRRLGCDRHGGEAEPRLLARGRAAGKQVIIGRSHAYHGVNAYGTSLGGIPVNTDPFGPLVTLVEHVPWDDPAALAKMIDQVGPDRVGAFICEPVVGAGGVYFPPEGYLAEVQQICRDADVLFIADEVITGFGRTGAWFGSERYGIEPDMMTVAKGLTSGYLPLGAVVASPQGRRAVLAARVRRDLPARLHLLRPPGRLRGRPGQPGHHRARAARARASGSLSPRWPPRSRRWPGTSWSARCAPAPGCSPGSSSMPAAREADPALGGRIVAAARERGVITRLLRGVALQVSPPFVISAAELHADGRGADGRAGRSPVELADAAAQY